MMARLIDADKFFQDFQKISFMNIEGHPMVAASVVLMLLDAQPTAYYVDKVVEEIDDFDDGACGCMRRCETEECLLEAIKKVVRKGGVDEK